MMERGLRAQEVEVPVWDKLIQNFDSTQYTVGESPDSKVWVSRGKSYSEPRTLKKTALNQGVKLYTVMTANGCMGPMVYAIAADSKMELKDGDMKKKRVMGLHAYACNDGWIVIQKTRTGSVEFFLWLYKLYAKWIAKNQQRFREIHSLGDDIKVPSLLTLDGELNQIKGAVADTTLEVFSQNDIMAMKLAPSCTHKLQPCDRSSVYKSSKYKLKAVQLKYKEPNRQRLELVTEALKSMGYRGKKMSVLATGIARINESVEAATSTDSVQMGWIKSGSWPLDQETMLNQCETSKEFKLGSNTITNKVTTLLNLHLKNGFITEADMDKLNVPKTELQRDQEEAGMWRDDFPLSRQRPRILNDPNFLALTHEREERQRRQDEEKKERKAQKAIEKERKAAERALEEEAKQERRRAKEKLKRSKKIRKSLLKYTIKIGKEAKKNRAVAWKKSWKETYGDDEAKFQFWTVQLPRMSAALKKKFKNRRTKIREREAKRSIAMMHYSGKKRPKSDEWYCSDCKMPYAGFQDQKLATRRDMFRQCVECEQTWCPDCKNREKMSEHEKECSGQENQTNKRKTKKRRR
jgi:hypothetical protein